MRASSTDLLAAAVFGLFGCYFCLAALTSLPLGNAFEMGPGYYPAILGGLLIFLAIIIALSAIGRSAAPLGAVPWRAVAMLSLSVIVFGLAVRPVGFAPATAFCVLCASLASRKAEPYFVIALSIGLTAFCLLVFRVLLGLPLPMFGYWLTG